MTKKTICVSGKRSRILCILVRGVNAKVLYLFLYSLALTPLILSPLDVTMQLCKTVLCILIYVPLAKLHSYANVCSQAVALDGNFLDAYINLGNVLKEARIFDR